MMMTMVMIIIFFKEFKQQQTKNNQPRKDKCSAFKIFTITLPPPLILFNRQWLMEAKKMDIVSTTAEAETN